MKTHEQIQREYERSAARSQARRAAPARQGRRVILWVSRSLMVISALCLLAALIYVLTTGSAG